MADPLQDSFFREIDEDLRQERYARLWKRYGNLVIAAAVAVVLAVAGYQLWRSRDLDQRRQAGDRLAQAEALAAVDPQAALKILGPIAADGPSGHALVAGLREAALLAQSGDTAAAAALYQKLAERAGSPLYRDLALLLAVVTEMRTADRTTDTQALRARLLPLTAGDRPLRYAAKEMSGYLALQAGDPKEARAVFTALAEDAGASPAMRARARAMATRVGGA